MKVKPRILLVGNFLSVQRTGSRGVCEDLSQYLQGTGYIVFNTSSRKGRISRLLDMVGTILSRRNEYDIACVDVYSGLAFTWAEVCAQFLPLLGKPFIFVLRGGGLPDFANTHSGRLRRAFSLATRVITPSYFLQKELAHLRSDIAYLPNAVSLAQYPDRLQMMPSPKLIWLRAFHQIYQPEIAVQAFAKVYDTWPTASLVMFGPEKHDGSLERVQSLIIALGEAGSRVHVRGGVPKMDVAKALQEGDIFLNTTRFESFGVSVLEAAACGLPIVSTNVGELPYLWKDGEDALLVSPGDYQAMASAILRLLDEPGLAERLSRNARRKAEAFDWSIILPQWERLFEEIQ